MGFNIEHGLFIQNLGFYTEHGLLYGTWVFKKNTGFYTEHGFLYKTCVSIQDKGFIEITEPSFITNRSRMLIITGMKYKQFKLFTFKANFVPYLISKYFSFLYLAFQKLTMISSLQVNSIRLNIHSSQIHNPIQDIPRIAHWVYVIFTV